MDTDEEPCGDAHSFRRIDQAFREGRLDALRAAVDDPAVVPNGRLPHGIGSCLVYAIAPVGTKIDQAHMPVHPSKAFEPGVREFGAFVRVVVGALVLLAASIADLAIAQDRPGPAAEFAAGWVGFADDGVVSESLIGGAARWFLRPRIASMDQ